MLFQFGALFTDLSVFENVAFPLREHTELDETMIREKKKEWKEGTTQAALSVSSLLNEQRGECGVQQPTLGTV